MRIFGIETSCDETASAMVSYEKGHFSVLGQTVFSQIDTHKQYGGIVPEVAARKHAVNIIPVISQTLEQANLDLSEIDVIAVTHGPGLLSSLLIGCETAKALAYAYDKPLVGVNHLEGHVLSALLDQPDLQLPALGVIVSGGHTQFVLMRDWNQYEIIGRTVDDAAGECFDKVAKMLNLPYPGGPEIQRLAQNGNAKTVDFPRPMIDSDDFDVSFSGLKTAVRYHLRDNPYALSDNKAKQDVCASFQQAVSDVIVQKTLKATKKHKVKTVVLAGGVAANSKIREDLAAALDKQKVAFHFPPIQYCMDNAVMIAIAGYFAYERGDVASPFELKCDPNLNF